MRILTFRAAFVDRLGPAVDLSKPMHRHIAPLLVLPLLVLPLLAHGVADAQDAPAADGLPAEVAVALPDCDPAPLPWAAVLTQLEIELRGMDVRLARGGPVDEEAARISLEVPGCAPDAQTVRLVIANLRTGRIAEAELAIPDRGSAERARVIALAVAEVLRSRWAALSSDVDGRVRALELWRRDEDDARARALEALSAELAGTRQSIANLSDELQAAQRAVVAAEERLAHLERTRLPTPAAPGILLHAQLAVWGYLGAGAGLLGPRIGVGLPVGPLRLRVDLEAAFAKEATRLGDVDVRSLGGALSLLAGHRPGTVALSMGPTLRLARTHARGEPFDPERFVGAEISGTLVTLGGRGIVRVALVGAVHLTAEIEAGIGMGGVDARIGSERVTALEGPFVGIALGAAVAP